MAPKKILTILCIMATLLFLNTASEMMAQQLKTELKPMKPVKPILFETAYGEYFEMSPTTLTIKYGTNVVNIGQGQSQTINIPEGSPLLNPQGNLSAMVEYSLRNKTTKNLRFRVGLKYGNTYLANKDLTFFGQKTIRVQHNVNLAPGSGHLTILVEGGNILTSTSDDTRPVFFNGRLWLRVYSP